MANEFVARKGLISLQTSSFLEDVNISGSVYIGTAATSSHLTVSGSSYISKGLTVDDGITGSLYGTASWAISASWAPLAISASYVSGSLSGSYIDFLQTADLPAQTGRLQWESDFGTLEFTLRGGTVTFPLGFEELSYVYNYEATTLNKGEVVYVSGSNNDRIGVKRASSAGDSTSARTLGLVADSIAAGGSGYVITRGILRDVDTSMYNAGDILFVSSSAGQVTNIKPQAPIHMVYAGFVTRVGAGNGIIFVMVQNGYELDEIHDVRILNKSTGDLLVQSSSGLWVNSKTLVGQYNLTGSMLVTGSIDITGSLSASFVNINSGIISSSQPALSISQSWNNAGVTFSAIKLDVTSSASGASSKLIEAAVGSLNQFTVDKNGNTVLGNTTSGGQRTLTLNDSGASGGVVQITAPGLSVKLTGDDVGSYTWRPFSLTTAGISRIKITDGQPINNIAIVSNYVLGWYSATSFPGGNQSVDTGLFRNASGIVEINNGTTGSFADLKLRTLYAGSGSVTTNTPFISGSQTWSGSAVEFTGIYTNITDTASSGSSKLIDLQTDNVTKFSINKNGNIQGNLNGITYSLTNQGGWPTLASSGGNGALSLSGPLLVSDRIILSSDNRTIIRGLYDGVYGIFEQYGSTDAPQKHRLYNTLISSTNFERLGTNWVGNVAQIYTETGSAGGSIRPIVLGTNSKTALTIDTDNNVSASYSLFAPSITGSLLGSSSYALTSSYANTASYVNPLVQNVLVTGSLNVSGSGLFVNGDVAINTTSSLVSYGVNAKLSVVSDLNVSHSIIIKDTYDSYSEYNKSYILFQNYLSNIVGGIVHPGARSLGLWADTSLRFYTAQGTIERMRIDDNGNVGIGRQYPSARLHVYNDNYIMPGYGNGDFLAKIVNNYNDNSYKGLYVYAFADVDQGIIAQFSDFGGDRFVIRGGGNIGIGKLNPTERLDVSGSVLITGSLNVTAGITGSLQGTASWAVTSSYSLKADSLLSGININVNEITASSILVTNLYVQNITSSTELVTGSLTVSGSLNALGGITGSLFGTSSYALQALTSSYLLGAGSASYIQFAEVTASQVTNAVGKLQWDELNRTLKFGLGGGNVNLQVGQENLVLVYNADATQIVDGEVLYMSGSFNERLAVKKASNTDDVTSLRTICVATEPINVGEIGFAAINAEISDVNTSAFSVGDLLWLDSTPGAVTNIKPDAPSNIVFVGTVLKVGPGDGRIHAYIQSIPGLRELHDVQISSIQDNQIIKYNQTNGRWENFDSNTLQTTVKTANYTITSADYVVIGNSATPFTITMLPASTNTNRNFVIKNKGSGKVTIDATGLGQIDGTNTYILNRYQSITLISDGTNWNII